MSDQELASEVGRKCCVTWKMLYYARYVAQHNYMAGNLLRGAKMMHDMKEKVVRNANKNMSPSIKLLPDKKNVTPLEKYCTT